MERRKAFDCARWTAGSTGNHGRYVQQSHSRVARFGHLTIPGHPDGERDDVANPTYDMGYNPAMRRVKRHVRH